MLRIKDVKLQLHKQKHPEFMNPLPEVLIEGPIRKIHSVVYDDVDDSLILKATTLMKEDQDHLAFMQMECTEF